MKFSLPKVTIAVTLLMSAGGAFANQIDNPNQLPQYVENGLTVINVDALTQQKDPLLTVMSISFPQQISTIGQALNYSLLRTGYTLGSTEKMTNNVIRLMQLPLPLVQRQIEQITVRNLISMLIGAGYDYRVDSVSRTVNIICPTEKHQVKKKPVSPVIVTFGNNLF